MVEIPPNKKGFKSRFAGVFSPKSASSTGRLQKKPPPTNGVIQPTLESLRKKSLGGRSSTDGQQQWEIDEQTGERDHTGLLHGLAHHESFDSLDSLSQKVMGKEPYRPPGEPMIASLSNELWLYIARFSTPTDFANLAISCKTLWKSLGSDPWTTLNQEENHRYKIQFLVGLDRSLPDHLLCIPCAKYHLRSRKGQEILKPTNVLNPLFKCPNYAYFAFAPSRIRLTSGHHLPFTFVQLVMRAHRFGPQYGISADTLSQRWKERNSPWEHQTRFYIHKGRLLFRTISRAFAPPGLPVSGQRILLYSREDYFPYFSACEHWRDGELMDVCKCALGHVVRPKATIKQQLQKGPAINLSLRNPDYFVSQCSVCRPIRRCPHCPTEYMVELKLAEDKTDPDERFKQAITVTRWSDLGDGRNPNIGPWAACRGQVDIDSFETIGKRALSGIFESQSGVTIPGQVILNLNPAKTKRLEDSQGWY